ncbi:MAG TPA: peroxiredoxin [Gammaproteobacteria bacterium]|nr:peroxiredoxin [Gammaproteobacteria bacterium]MEC8010939.1 redoxin domain-containing protein [Pseudomonadota bacterium]HBF10007.1 peroxiredoxin [Gammaproteobacteria bacterium]HCK92292.1 peroxiredoxin [Gammaproteobacteria bacterium]|tara:strand:+ start:977 stop:1621 length:645 start_codon:yes stop_codon:yes gene_type:complete
MQDATIQEEMTFESDAASQLLGKQLPSFTATATNNFDIDFTRLQGYQTVVFFYPQSGLPGVTQIAKDFAEHYASFKQIKTCVFGVSLESLETSQAFKDQLELPFQLIADTDSELAQWFNTLTERTIFGDPIKTLEQSTFLINAEGVISDVWRNPEVRGHVEDVIEAAHRLSEGLSDDTSAPVTTAEDIEADKPVLEESEAHTELKADLADLFEA